MDLPCPSWAVRREIGTQVTVPKGHAVILGQPSAREHVKGV